MEFFWEMLSLQETMFLLILTGVLIKKLKIIDAAGRKMLSDLLIDVILPCNIVESFLGGMVFPDGFARNCLLAVGLSAVIQLMSIYGSKLLFRKYPREQRSVLSYGIICSNSSFVGLPVARLMFGDLGVIYTSRSASPCGRRGCPSSPASAGRTPSASWSATPASSPFSRGCS